jgi:hypothetical protein
MSTLTWNRKEKFLTLLWNFERVKKWMLVDHMLGISHPLDDKFCESFNQYIHPNSQKEVLNCISTRHLAMSQVCRTAMVLTDKNLLYVCINIFCVVTSLLLTINFTIRYTLL